ncbi:lytic transglycosylase domain-containing protein [Paracoccus suum]|uniref:Lytic transglycosylase domain-containing protein n=2 Tax=Paracoccus suum TaxID=2259340 RepID=A0A344PP34_9RHOB|nr:lytic transglycosylase domain-containing protein [Paracoccus suum]
MRWGSRRGSDAWTSELLAALESHGGRLVQVVPADVSAYCPSYVTAGVEQRKAFWAGLVSSIAKHESTWNPGARGGGGKWLGLMQIAPSTWRAYGCDGQILDGGDNLSCAVRIMAKQVGRDGVIAGGGARGVGRDWAPMRSGSKRADIAGWTRQQSYCNG